MLSLLIYKHISLMKSEGFFYFILCSFWCMGDITIASPLKTNQFSQNSSKSILFFFISDYSGSPLAHLWFSICRLFMLSNMRI